MDEPSTDGLYETVVGDDLRDLGVPMLLFTSGALDLAASDAPEVGPPREVDRAAADADVAMGGLVLFGTDAYRLQRALGAQVFDGTVFDGTVSSGTGAERP